jgi:hypothetical protein
MNLPSQSSIPNQPEGHGIVLGEALSGGKREQRRRRNEAGVQVENILDAAAIRGLLDEWLVPAIVERFIRDLTNSSLDGER